MTRTVADDLVIQTLAETEIELRQQIAKLEDEACWQCLIARCAIEDLHAARKRHASLQRQHKALKDEYASHRERTMRASLIQCTSEPEAASPYPHRGSNKASTYTTTPGNWMPPRRSPRRTWQPPQGIS
jgi:hypothetical protein